MKGSTLNGNIVKKLREDKKISQSELSFETGLDIGLISKIENNKRKSCSLYTAFKLAIFFEIKIEDMM